MKRRSDRADSSQLSNESDGIPSPRKRVRRSESSGAESDAEKPLQVYIVQAKLDSNDINGLYSLVEGFPNNGVEQNNAVGMELCSDVRRADIIITAVRMRRRLERHINWNIARQKAVVTPEWLRDSAKQGRTLPCGEYAALPELEQSTEENCPDSQYCDSHIHNHIPFTSALVFSLESHTPSTTDTAVFDNWRARFSCQRACPLVCPNQGLATQLSVLCRNREMEGLQRNALAYERAVGMIKSYPRVITRESFEIDIVKLPGMGEKIASKVEEYVETGFIEETQTILASGRHQALTAFASIYGVGPAKARQFYDMGMRSIQDLERYFDIVPGSLLKTPAEIDAFLAQIEEVAFTPNGRRIKAKDKAPDITIPAALALRGEFDIPIPRQEAEEIRDFVMKELEEIQPGCVNTIVGGYRRGKPMSNDADIVISYPDFKRGKEIIPGLCKRLTVQLYKKGLVTHVMHLSGFHSYNALRTEHWDSLEKALTVFKLPPVGNTERIHRRLDLIFAVPESYWTAVIGWTGSKLFERDLRLWAKQKQGMKFDSVGLTRRHDTRRYLPKSEKEVFDILGLPWIDPTMRNADA